MGRRSRYGVKIVLAVPRQRQTSCRTSDSHPSASPPLLLRRGLLATLERLAVADAEYLRHVPPVLEVGRIFGVVAPHARLGIELSHHVLVAGVVGVNRPRAVAALAARRLAPGHLVDSAD